VHVDFVSGDGLMATLRFTLAYLSVVGVMVLGFRTFETRDRPSPTRDDSPV
jgi:hypothetical protein